MYLSGNTLTLGTLSISDSSGALAVTSEGSPAKFSSVGITDNATSTAITIDTSQNVTIGSASNHSGARIVINDTPPTAFGSPMLQVGQETFTASGYYSIGLGYTAASYTNPPTEIAAVSTSSSGGTTAELVFATRSVTTDTAPTERMRIYTDGKISVANGLGFLDDEGGDSFVVYGGTTNGSGLLLHGNAAKILPVRNGASIDATIDIGQSSRRFKDIYLSGGAYLGGTGAANHLDDYEEGTWTPVLNGSPTHSGSNQYYVKIGNLVYVGAYIYSVSDYTSTTDFTISGLPFATNNARGVGSVMFRDINDSTIAQLNSYVSTNSSTLYFYASQNNGGNWDPLEYADGDAGLIDIIFNITYLVS